MVCVQKPKTESLDSPRFLPFKLIVINGILILNNQFFVIMTQLSIGSAVPAFQALNLADRPVTGQDYQGAWWVLYFYPKDNTPGCTTEAIDFTQLLPDFQALGAKIVGVSTDSVATHCKFIAKQQLQIELLSDPDHQMVEAFGMWQLKKFMGKEYMGIVRSTFIIDPQGKIAHLWPKVKVKGHAAEVLAWLTTNRS
jgi:thioredoxin-dependent peroxiredoxin